jgi:hypothetical protein
MKWPMLTRRGAVYYHRQVVPLALRPLLDNRREIWKSLDLPRFRGHLGYAARYC